MAIVVVGGSGKDVGKTALVCAVIAALRDFEWTAVKITAHDYPKSNTADLTTRFAEPIIREETQAGQQTDTARYLAAGAKRALLVTRSDSNVPFEEIRAALVHDRNVIFESNRIVGYLKPDLCLALASGDEKKPSYELLLRHADALVMLNNAQRHSEAEGLRIFRIVSTDRLPDEMVSWMIEKLTRS